MIPVRGLSRVSLWSRGTPLLRQLNPLVNSVPRIITTTTTGRVIFIFAIPKGFVLKTMLTLAGGVNALLTDTADQGLLRHFKLRVRSLKYRIDHSVQLCKYMQNHLRKILFHHASLALNRSNIENIHEWRNLSSDVISLMQPEENSKISVITFDTSPRWVYFSTKR